MRLFGFLRFVAELRFGQVERGESCCFAFSFSFSCCFACFLSCWCVVCAAFAILKLVVLVFDAVWRDVSTPSTPSTPRKLDNDTKATNTY